MTTNTNPRRNIDHSSCGHPLTKQARAMCRRARGTQGPVPLTTILPTQAIATPRTDIPERDVHFTWLMGPKNDRVEYTPCKCKGKLDGFTDRGDGVWVHSTCGNPTRFYILNVLGGLLTA